MRQLVVLVATAALGVAAGCGPKAGPTVATPAPVVAVPKDGLAKPIQLFIEHEGRPYHDVIYPFLGDIDGDGLPDLLLGTRNEGRLLVYSNVRAVAGHRFTSATWFDAWEPTGKIPAG